MFKLIKGKLHFILTVMVLSMLWILFFSATDVQAQATSIRYTNDPSTGHYATYGPSTVVTYSGGGGLQLTLNGSYGCTATGSPQQCGGWNQYIQPAAQGTLFTVTPGGASCTVQRVNGFVYCGVAVPPPPDGDNDGVPDASDACPAQGDQGFGVDGSGCPNPPVDIDGDGVFDNDDACPTTGDLGYGLQGNGCPVPPPDADNDNVIDDNDQCVNTPGILPHGCPDADRDDVYDQNDSCPNEAGPARNSGCPIPGDMDGDGKLDDVDECPNEFGTLPNGCPQPDRDGDGDGIPDVTDRCPNQPGLPWNGGCPEGQEPLSCPPEGCQVRTTQIPEDTNLLGDGIYQVFAPPPFTTDDRVRVRLEIEFGEVTVQPTVENPIVQEGTVAVYSYMVAELTGFDIGDFDIFPNPTPYQLQIQYNNANFWEWELRLDSDALIGQKDLTINIYRPGVSTEGLQTLTLLKTIPFSLTVIEDIIEQDNNVEDSVSNAEITEQAPQPMSAVSDSNETDFDDLGETSQEPSELALTPASRTCQTNQSNEEIFDDVTVTYDTQYCTTATRSYQGITIFRISPNWMVITINEGVDISDFSITANYELIQPRVLAQDFPDTDIPIGTATCFMYESTISVPPIECEDSTIHLKTVENAFWYLDVEQRSLTLIIRTREDIYYCRSEDRVCEF